MKYESALDDNRDIPAWLDETLKKAVHLDPYKRYEELSEFVFELRQPNKNHALPVPLIERNPLLFWKCLSLILAIVILVLLFIQYGNR